MNSTDTLPYKVDAFNNAKYVQLQKSKILERIDKFRNGKLYLEIGGKFLHDPHAARVLPGFRPDVKKQIFLELRNISEILFCVNARDIVGNRQLKNNSQKYTDAVKEMIEKIEEEIGAKPKVIITLVDQLNKDSAEQLKTELASKDYLVYMRYKIDGYPQDTEKVLSEKGYGKDDFVTTTKKLIIVIGAASNSGKMSTCLGQIYQDQQKGIDSGYAKYETFPIWSLPIDHPVNLAYEASTADIGDYNLIDKYHMDAYGKRAVNYNRDVEAFELIKGIGEKFLEPSNFMYSYRSPTDMGINYAGSAIENDEAVCVASLNEIRRRADWYQMMLDRGEGRSDWVEKCRKLERQATKYIEERGFDINMELI